MTVANQPSTTALVRGLHTVLANPLLGIAPALAELLSPLIRHSALVIFTEDCTGRPQKRAGEPSIADHVTVAEMDVVREQVRSNHSATWAATGIIAGTDRLFAGWIASSGALMVLTDPVLASPTAETLDEVMVTVAGLWDLVALSIRHQVAAATPAYLFDSRTMSVERAAIIAELSDAHSTTLEMLLAVLRSRKASDAAARRAATDIAATAMVKLRAVADRDHKLSKEPVAKAFESLQSDLRPLARFGDLDIQFIEPPVNGRALPGEVAHAGRAIVRGAVLALVEQSGVSRVRVQWDCDGRNLLINIRDDGPGDLTVDSPNVRQLSARVIALDGTLRVEATKGWGSEIFVSLPLDPVATHLNMAPAWALTSQEKRVLELVASGIRNRAIGDALNITENTVKFHVANVLKKVGASNRAELASIVNIRSLNAT